jgi:hypothetical protein
MNVHILQKLTYKKESAKNSSEKEYRGQLKESLMSKAGKSK